MISYKAGGSSGLNGVRIFSLRDGEDALCFSRRILDNFRSLVFNVLSFSPRMIVVMNCSSTSRGIRTLDSWKNLTLAFSPLNESSHEVAGEHGNVIYGQKMCVRSENLKFSIWTNESPAIAPTSWYSRVEKLIGSTMTKIAATNTNPPPTIINKQRLIVIPIAKKMGVSSRKPRTVAPNTVLEAAWKDRKPLNHEAMKGLAKQTDMTERQVEVWFRRRKALNAPTPLAKFRECRMNRGKQKKSAKPYFWKSITCWEDWPYQHVSSDMYWHYVVELGFYWSLVFTLCTDHKRKLTKMSIYVKNKNATDGFFVLFLVIWILSRVVYYPYVVLYSTTIETYYAGIMDNTFGAHWFFNFFLYLLQVLHLIWTYMIFRIVYRKIVKGNVEDVRSDSEDDDGAEADTESENEAKETNELKGKNGTQKKNGFKKNWSAKSHQKVYTKKRNSCLFDLLLLYQKFHKKGADSYYFI
ncbi:CERS4-like protein [Mya arenaria]|uniref:CERS4-like protein n=1 Tax=Mya arenaria TaxID=6604 RepID=A0ABY7DCH6_MYAAR|nr:CERS4-like protein [Mya arenaria]